MMSGKGPEMESIPAGSLSGKGPETILEYVKAELAWQFVKSKVLLMDSAL